MSDWEFIFDGVFGFLTSPIWEVPIMSFIETQSIVFEPSEENLESWTEIHNKYKNLVESLLTSFLKDVGITEQQFMKACGSPSARNIAAMQPVYEQLWATEDYEIFKRMMIQRNIELQLQALELIRKRQGKAKKKEKKVKTQTVSKTEEEILAEVIKKSEEEYKEGKSKDNEVVYDPSMELKISQAYEDNEKLENEVLKSQEETKKTVMNGLEIPPAPVEAEPATSAPVKYEPKPLQKEAVSDQTKLKTKKDGRSSKEKAKEEELKALRNPPPKPSVIQQEKEPENKTNEASNNSLKPKESVNDKVPTKAPVIEPTKDELFKRGEYLKQQRDRLLALKKEEREKKLSDYTKQKPGRPSSARVARQAISGEVSAEPTEAEKKQIAMRKALAEKLKREVVYK